MINAENIPEQELEFSAIRASGPGGQNVNKVSTAMHLRFDIGASSLPEWIKERLLSLNDRRISSEGVLVIKAQRTRSQEKNRIDALARLDLLLAKAQQQVIRRIPTRPKKSAVKKRLDNKAHHSTKKKNRQVTRDD